MKREDLKKTIPMMKQDFMSKGANENEAETHLVNVLYSMAKSQKLGLYDVKIAMDILDLEPVGELSKTMEEFKKELLRQYQIERCYPGEPDDKKHYKRDPETKEGLFNDYKNGDLDDLEFEMLMWASGWELSPKWFDLKDGAKKKSLVLLED